MVAYSFQPRFEDALRAGLQPGPWQPGMKRSTLRPPARKASRHARVHGPISLYTGLRKPGARLVGKSKCVLVQRARLMCGPDGLWLAFASGSTCATAPDFLPPVLWALLADPASADIEAVAQAEGFDDAAQMEAFFRPPMARKTWMRELVMIAWKPAT